MFLKISMSDKLRNVFPGLEYAKGYIDSAKRNVHKSRSEKSVGFLSGNAGIYAVSVGISSALNDQDARSHDLKKFLDAIPIYKRDESLADEMLVGRAGYVCGLKWINEVTNQSIVSDLEFSNLLEVMLKNGKDYAAENDLNIPIMYNYHGREYLGAAHGVSLILLMFLDSQWFKNYPECESDSQKNSLELIRTSIDVLLELQDHEGNFPSKFGIDESHLVHWCHGSPGMVYLMAKSYLIFKEEKYLNSCLKAGELIWRKGLLLKGPGICHGVAGNGYVFLLLYRLTNDKKHLYRATKFMEFLTNSEFLRKARTPDRPHSLYEGVAGTICFLVDLLEPDKSSFPFMNIFRS